MATNSTTTVSGAEKRRIKAAQRLLANNPHREVFQGYFRISDEEIMITDGYMLYVGEPIAGIAETKYPGSFRDFRQTMSEFPFEKFAEIINYKVLKRQWKIAKAKKIPYDHRALHNYIDEARLEITNSDGITVYFNLELILAACELVGEHCVSIKICAGKKAYKSPAIVEGIYGICYVMPFIKND